jgi:UPF0716 protein FxsA
MRLAARILIAILLLPAAEVIAFVLVAWLIGFFPALGLMLLTSFAGAWVLRHSGLTALTRLRGMPGRDATLPGAGAAGGPFIALGGILLLLPGFITDILGAGLLLEPTRRGLGDLLRRTLLQTRGRRSAGAAGSANVIELEPGEWRRIAERKPRGAPRR